MNDNARMVERIDRCWDKLPSEDQIVLGYVRSQITPEALERRSHDDVAEDVAHLRAVARTRLRPYEPRKDQL